MLTASNGKEALEMYRQRSAEISLIVLDLIMPEMGGKQCLGELLKAYRDVKVVIAAGMAPSGPADSFIEVGAKGFVRKPYRTIELLRTIRDVLEPDHCLPA